MAGYFRYPTIHDDHVVFVAEDDLWSISAAGGVARRLTANLGPTARPRLSPDGRWLAFAGREDGPPEIYCMPALGGPAQRITYLGGCLPAGWSRDGEQVLFASSNGKPFPSMHEIYQVARGGGHPRPLGTGLALSIAESPGGAVVLGRNGLDAARWKRYRGGTAGRLWISPEGDGNYRPLIDLDGNPGWPMWIDERLYFVCDHEGIGNLYSCLPTGEDKRRHTDHEEFYARNPTTDGRHIVYHAGGDLFIYSAEDDQTRRIEVQLKSSRTALNRRFVPAQKYLSNTAIHPLGHSLALTARGKMFTMGNWEGAVTQHGEAHGVRYRRAQWVDEGSKLVCVADTQGEERVEIFSVEEDLPPRRIEGLDLGLTTLIAVAPRGGKVAVANQRFELILIDLDSGGAQIVDRSRFARIEDLAWSPDGRWLCYSFGASMNSMQLKLCNTSNGETHALTPPEFVDYSPSFSPDGKYLYFLSYREFNPVYDSMHFELGFPYGSRPYLLTLREDVASPFVLVPRPFTDEKEHSAPGEDKQQPEPESIEIDLKGIQQRVQSFPVPEARYTAIHGAGSKVFYSSVPSEGALQSEDGEDDPKGSLHVWDFAAAKEEVFAEEVSAFDLSPDGRALLYRCGERLRMLPLPDPPAPDLPSSGRKSGWIDLGRVRLAVDPAREWRQMYRESWRLMRENFWTADLSDVDWQRIHDRYLPLIDRVSTRGELSDLLWEMQGELGTSHAYEMAGDYRLAPRYDQGRLGADLEFDADQGAYRIAHIVRGDPWDERCRSPLAQPGLNVAEGDLLVAVGGRQLSADYPPEQALVHLAGCEVTLGLKRGEKNRSITVKALQDDTRARYREWVENNRRQVHEATGGRSGYVHVPDMGPWGYAEFHRYFLAELGKDALIVDARFNRGGHVSQLLLEKLARKPIGYTQPRWGVPTPYPGDSIPGSIVTISNEFAGSDGDIFCHCFKLMGLGPLIGTRTWGGVVGIWPRHALVDGTVTTQPEFSFWFQDVGWEVEGHGTEPDIEVPFRPQDYAAGADPQLARAIEETRKALESAPPPKPDLRERPKRTLPTLPKRD